MPLVDNPTQTLYCDVDRCGGCGGDLTGAPVARVERRQVTDVAAPPPPRVTEYRIITRTCPCCASAQAGAAPQGVGARAQYGPGVLAAAAELTCAHYLPVARAAALMATLAGIAVSVGFIAGVRGRTARLLEAAFLPRVRELLGRVGVLHVDETPARADKHLGYVHVAATEWLTAMHTGGRSKTDIDNGAILPGHTGTIVRDGYAGYTHLTDALHAWCGAHYPDLRIIPTSARLALVGGGARAGVVGIITALRGTRVAGRGAGSGRGCWSAGWSGSALALSA
jgi:transposase